MRKMFISGSAVLMLVTAAALAAQQAGPPGCAAGQ